MRPAHDNLSSMRDEIGRLIRSIDLEQVALFSRIFRRAARSQNFIYVFGNGGSATLAMHLVADILQTAQARTPQPAIRVNSLCGEIGALTALANDFRYEESFSRQLSVLLRKSDVVLALSTSGQSPNVLAALAQAETQKAMRLGLVGSRGTKMMELCDHCVMVDSKVPKIIETVHLAFVQLLVEDLRSMPSDKPGDVNQSTRTLRTTTSKPLKIKKSN